MNPISVLLLSTSCLILVLSACGSDSIVCPGVTEPAIVAEIRDAFDDRPLAAEALGSVRDGEYLDSLRPYETSGNGVLYSRAAGDDRDGIYFVEVTHPGYSPWEMAGIRVRANTCSVETERLQVRLSRLQ
jgi:hypothetical protein